MIGRHAKLAGRAARMLVDTCTLTTRTIGAQGADGLPSVSETSAALACRYVESQPREDRPYTAQIAQSDGALYLPVGTSPTNLVRATITHRDGVALASPIALVADGPADVTPAYTKLPVRREVR